MSKAKSKIVRPTRREVELEKEIDRLRELHNETIKSKDEREINCRKTLTKILMGSVGYEVREPDFYMNRNTSNEPLNWLEITFMVGKVVEKSYKFDYLQNQNGIDNRFRNMTEFLKALIKDNNLKRPESGTKEL